MHGAGPTPQAVKPQKQRRPITFLNILGPYCRILGATAVDAEGGRRRNARRRSRMSGSTRGGEH